MRRRAKVGRRAARLVCLLLTLPLPLLLQPLSAAAAAPSTGISATDLTREQTDLRATVSYRLEGREAPLASGDWVPAGADIRLAVEGTGSELVRAFRIEVFTIEDGERVPIEVPGLQEWEKQTRKWIHTDLTPEEAVAGRWIWSGTLRPGERIVLQWREADSGQVVPHPVTLRIVDTFGAKLAFATPVSVVFPVTGEATVTASAGFSVRYYRISNRPFWRTLERIGFPAISLSYATIGGRKSVLYSIGISAIGDQLHLYYGGFRNSLTANNFWMFGLSLKTSDLMAAARRALK